MNNKVRIGGIIALIIIVVVIAVCYFAGKFITDKLRDINDQPPETSRPDPSKPLPRKPANIDEAKQVYLALGNPSGATESIFNPNDYLMVNKYYALSYNRSRATANWAAWRITKDDMSDLKREDSFRPDDRLPRGWAKVRPTDYRRSGFDRGHIVPNADRDGDRESMAATFVMTNMLPQTGDLNRGPWAKLEGYLRTLVRRGSDVYVFAGAYGDKGKIKNKITIPEKTWKIAVAVPAGKGLDAINKNTRVIAVDMPNVKGIKNADWQLYRTSVKDLERKTGYDFFSNLPKDLQNSLESKVDKINN